MNDEKGESKFDQERLDDLKQQSAALKKKHEVSGATLKVLTERTEEILKEVNTTRERE